MKEDVNLVELQVEDIELVRNWRNSEEVSKYMYSDRDINEEEQKEWFNHIKDDATKKYWLLVYKGQKVGLASLYNINLSFKSCYWAFYLGDTSIRGAGIGAKTEYNVLQYVFNTLSFNKLLCEVFVTNDKVVKMHEKFGFRRESYFREHIFKNNQFHDVVGLAMLKSEWERLEPYQRQKIYGE